MLHPLGALMSTGEYERKFLKRGRNDPTTGRPAVIFKFGDECFFSKCDIVKILPFLEVTGTTKRQKNMYFHRTSKFI